MPGRPVLMVYIGTTLPPVHFTLQGMATNWSNLVPYRSVFIDSLPFEHFVRRQAQEGWSMEQVQQLIPPAHYFELPLPFVQDFDFEHPLNRKWKYLLFDPNLRRIASRSNSPGCNGTPAMGRARVEGCIQELSSFLQKHLRELTHMREDNLDIEAGVIAPVITTYRGGTGTGASLPVGAILKECLHDGEVHLHAAMPDIYGGDQRALANAYATVFETQGYHRYNQKVVTMDGRSLPSPFDSVTYFFDTNGRLTLDHKDVVMQEVAILSAYIKAPTQSAIRARHVDLTDITPYDHTDRPTHVRLETGLFVNVIQPGVLDYEALKWILGSFKAKLLSFKDYTKNERLMPEDEEILLAFQEKLKSDETIPVAADQFLSLFDGSQNAANVIRGYFERIGSTIGAMKSGTIKEQMNRIVPQVQDAFDKFERAWKQVALKLAGELPERILERIREQFSGDWHLILAALKKTQGRLLTLCEQLEGEVKVAKEVRGRASGALNQALKEVQEARSPIPFLSSDQVVRDAALKAIQIAQNGAMARVEQQQREFLLCALKGELGVPGEAGSIPCIIKTIEDLTTEELKQFRLDLAHRTKTLHHRIKEVEKAIERNSPIFQPSLICDDTSQVALDKTVEELRKKTPFPAPIEKYLKGKQDLTATVIELKPLLPLYAEATQNLLGILDANPERREFLCQLLKSATPFTPLNPVVEGQQRFRNRRDHLLIIELPGGRTTHLAQYLLSEGVVPDENQIVDSADDEIRMYFMRDGLSYGVVRPFLNSYAKAYQEHQAKASSVTPHTFEGYHRFPGLEPPALDLNTYIEELLNRAMAVLPERVREKPSGGFLFHYDEDSGHGFTRPREEEFHDFAAMATWVARRPKIHKELETHLKADLDQDPEKHKGALHQAWKRAIGKQKEHLEEALLALKVNPATFDATRRPRKDQRNPSQSAELKLIKEQSTRINNKKRNKLKRSAK